MDVRVQPVGVPASGLSPQDLGLVPVGESGSRLARPAALMAFQDWPWHSQATDLRWPTMSISKTS